MLKHLCQISVYDFIAAFPPFSKVLGVQRRRSESPALSVSLNVFFANSEGRKTFAVTQVLKKGRGQGPRCTLSSINPGFWQHCINFAFEKMGHVERLKLQLKLEV